MPGGFFTDQLFTQFKGREILRFEGPLGTFYLREDSDKPMIFVAGGTGFAPIKAMIEHALHHGIDRADGALLGRALAARSVPARPARPAGSRTHPNFTFIPVLSDPRPDDAWPGRTGFVHQAVLDDFPDLSGYQVYACGAPAMIDAARRDFTRSARPAGRRVLRRQLHVRGRGGRAQGLIFASRAGPASARFSIRAIVAASVRVEHHACPGDVPAATPRLRDDRRAQSFSWKW